MIISNINWKRVGDVYKFRDCVLRPPRGSQLRILSEYSGEPFDLYICFPDHVVETTYSGKVVFVFFDTDQSQALIDEAVRYLENLLANKRRNLVNGKTLRKQQHVISVTRIGEDVVYLANLAFEDSEIHEIRHRCVQVLCQSNLMDYIATACTHSHLQRLVDLDKACTQAVHTLQNTGILTTTNPYIATALKELGFMQNHEEVTFCL